MKEKKSPQRYERITELSTWIVMAIILFGVRFLPQNPIGNEQTYLIIGGILSFAMIYYMVICRYFSRSNRLYLKTIADIVFIGLLIHVLKDYGQFFLTLYFLPIFAAALSLELVSALLIATLAATLVAFEVFSSAQNLLPTITPALQSLGQIGFILFITIFCRFLAIQLKEEQKLKEESWAQQKFLKEKSEREKEFLSLTSHQLNTPISIIRGFASILKDDKYGKLNPQQADAVNEIYHSSKRMVHLISEISSVSRIQADAFAVVKKPTDLIELINNIAKHVEQMKKPDNTFILDIPEKLEPILIDEERIRMVIYNIINNSIKYSPHGQITLKVSQAEDKTRFSIKDNGVGISHEDLEKIFQPFYRGKNILELDNSGTGLGLYIAHLIIEKHNGKIYVHSKINEGSEFIFTLPNEQGDK